MGSEQTIRWVVLPWQKTILLILPCTPRTVDCSYKLCPNETSCHGNSQRCFLWQTGWLDTYDRVRSWRAEAAARSRCRVHDCMMQEVEQRERATQVWCTTSTPCPARPASLHRCTGGPWTLPCSCQTRGSIVQSAQNDEDHIQRPGRVCMSAGLPCIHHNSMLYHVCAKTERGAPRLDNPGSLLSAWHGTPPRPTPWTCPILALLALTAPAIS